MTTKKSETKSAKLPEAKGKKAVSGEKETGGEKKAATVAPAKKKLCRIISYEKMSPEIKALFDARYPEGYADFVTRYPKPSGESFYAVSLYTEDADFLIKVDVDVDLALDEDYDTEPATEDDVAGEALGEDQNSPDVNDLADSLADEVSDPA